MLELSHKYIQWLFPSTSSSKYNSHAPILTEEDIRVLRNSMIAKQNMIRSLVLMLKFYGLEVLDYTGCILGIRPITDDSPNSFKKRSKFWLRKNNHNYLRITRTLKSLCLFDLENYAQALLTCMTKIYENTNVISENNLAYWKETVKK